MPIELQRQGGDDQLPETKGPFSVSKDPKMALGLDIFINQERERIRKRLVAVGYPPGDLTMDVAQELHSWVSFGIRRMPGGIIPTTAKRRKDALLDEAKRVIELSESGGTLSSNQKVILIAARNLQMSSDEDLGIGLFPVTHRTTSHTGSFSPTERPSILLETGPMAIRQALIDKKAQSLVSDPRGVLEPLRLSEEMSRFVGNVFSVPNDLCDLVVATSLLGTNEEAWWRRIGEIEESGQLGAFSRKLWASDSMKPNLSMAEVADEAKIIMRSTGMENQKARLREEFGQEGIGLFGDYLMIRLTANEPNSRMLKGFPKFMAEKGLRWLNEG